VVRQVARAVAELVFIVAIAVALGHYGAEALSSLMQFPVVVAE
jgi:hypothetical protein